MTIVQHTNWKQQLRENADCESEKFSLNEMLDNYLGYVQHGLQHNDFTAQDIQFVTIDSRDYLQTPSVDGDYLCIPLKDLSRFGYNVQQGQTAENFVNENWNLY